MVKKFKRLVIGYEPKSGGESIRQKANETGVCSACGASEWVDPATGEPFDYQGVLAGRVKVTGVVTPALMHEHNCPVAQG